MEIGNAAGNGWQKVEGLGSPRASAISFKNRYEQYLSSDFALCEPVLDREKLDAILRQTAQVAETMVGTGPLPGLLLDLEQLQVTNYAALPPASEEQRKTISGIQGRDPILAQEMTFLALRSLISFAWGEPSGEDDAKRAAAFDYALEWTLTRVAGSTAAALSHSHALLPYWGRLAFLRVVSGIPDEQIEAFRLNRFACALVKNPTFNAHSYQWDEHGVIGLNYALDPILKSFNKIVLHYFHTHSLAGPLRLKRVWQSLLPVAAYFWSLAPVPVTRLARMQLFFDADMAAVAHSLTASQVDFIVRHELGHLVLNHGIRLRSFPKGAEAQVLRREFEFAADAFAQSCLRSTLVNSVRCRLQWRSEETGTESSGDGGLRDLHNYQAEVTAVRLLFKYMDVVDQIARLLKRRLGDSIGFRMERDSHPSATERLARLDVFQVGEHPPTSQILRYADALFKDVLEYAESLNDCSLQSGLADVYSELTGPSGAT